MKRRTTANGRARMAGWLAARSAVGGLLLATLALGLTGGCLERRGAVGEAGEKTLAAYSQKNAPAATDTTAEKPAPAPNRFANLPKKPADAAEAKPTPAPAGTRLVGFVDPLTRSKDRVPVTLEACLRRALANNLGVQIARYGPPIARTSVREAEAIFDPSWFLNNALGRIKQETGNFIFGAPILVARQWDFSTGIQTLLPTGATAGISQDWTYQKSNSTFLAPNPQFEGKLRFNASQPLLRGGGIEVNRSPIVIARLNQRISVADFKIQLMNTILAVETAYWDLVVADTTVQSIVEALGAAEENRRIVRRRFEEGKDKRIVVSLAESAATSRRAELVSARLNLAQTSDRLKRLINDPELPLQQPMVLAATELPIVTPMPVGLPMLQESMVAAMNARPELDQAWAQVAQASVQELVARNNRLPQLDVSAGFSLNGLDGQWEKMVDKEYETRFYDWSTGLTASMPIGNRARTAAYERSRLVEQQTLRNREDVRQRILLEVSEAVRNLAAAEELILARRAQREAAEQTLRDEEAFVGAGAALLKDLLDAQRDLALAKVQEMQAQVSYMVGLAALERAKGTLLDYNNLKVVDDVVKAPPAQAVKPAE